MNETREINTQLKYSVGMGDHLSGRTLVYQACSSGFDP